MKNRIAATVILVVAVSTLSIILGCTRKSSVDVVAFTPSPTPAPTPKNIAPADLQKLRWIEGSWRGTGVDQPPFFERYRFESDTVLAVDSFDDEKLTKVSDTTRFELKDGEFGGGGEGSRYVAVALDDNLITFAPVFIKARERFHLEARVERHMDGNPHVARQ